MKITILNKLFERYGILALVGLLLLAYSAYAFYEYLSDRGVVGYEGFDEEKNKNNLASASISGYDESDKQNYTSIDAASSQSPPVSNVNPNDLLPLDNNTDFGDLNQVGPNLLSGVNLLDSGYHIGTISQVKRNMNLQDRPEPTIPLINTGPWNQPIKEPPDPAFNRGFDALR